MKKHILILLLVPIMLFSQKENYNWHFGYNCGITFNPGGTPTSVSTSAISTWEGCASISDSLGNLLFYTDGCTVYNNLHLTMSNGTGLDGHNSSTSSALIIPRNSYAGQYYIFTIDAGERNQYGLRYSVVDMNADSGRGAVTDKNILMLNGVVEAQTAVHHSNGCDSWVVTYRQADNQFYAFLINGAGISSPVTSPAEATQSTGCYMRFSRDRSKFAVTDSRTSKYYLYDFDNTNGTFSNPRIIKPTGLNWPYGVEFSPDGTRLYGSCFNPSKVYQFDLTLPTPADISNNAVTLATSRDFYDWGALQLGPDGKIYVADYQAQNLEVINSPNTLGMGCNFQRNAVLLTTGRCGLGLPTFLDSYCSYDISITSNEPLCTGDTLFLTSTTQTGTNISWSGPNGFTSNQRNPVIPNVTPVNAGIYSLSVNFSSNHCCSDQPTVQTKIRVNDIPDAVITASGPLEFCEGGNVTLSVPTGTPSQKWSTSETTPSIRVYKSGTYKVTVNSNPKCYDEDSVTVVVHSMYQPKIISDGANNLCEADSVVLKPDSTNMNFKYLWSTGSTDSIIVVKTAGTYSLIITNEFGCKDSASFVVTRQMSNKIAKIISLGPNSICDGDSLILKADSVNKNYKYLWSTSSKDTMIVVKSPGLYSLTVTNQFGCQDSTPFIVGIFPTPKFSIKSSGSILKCRGDSLLLKAIPEDANCRYNWSTGSNATKIYIKTGGVYHLTVTNPNGCSSIDSVKINQNNLNPKITADGPIDFCLGDSVVLTGNPSGKGYYSIWSNGSTGSSIVVKTSGKYIYAVTNQDGCTESDTMTVHVSTKLAVSIQGDNKICQGDSTFLLAQPSGSAYKYLWSTGDSTNWIYASKPGIYWVIVSLNTKCSDSTSIEIFEAQKPHVTLSSIGSTTFCTGDSVILKAIPGESGYNYLWSTGEKSDSIIVKTNGDYFVVATNPEGCKDTASINLKVTDVPNTKIIASGKVEFCTGDSIILSAEPIGTGYNYLWSTGEKTQKIIVRQSGHFLVTVSINDKCFDSDSIDVSVLQAPEVAILGKTSICSGEKTILMTDRDFNTYKWSTGETASSIEIQTSGNYSVTVTDTNGCSNSASITVIENKIIISGQQNIDFGIASSGSNSSQKLTLKNESNFVVGLKSVRLKDNSSGFSIETNPLVPTAMASDQSLEVTVYFNPITNRNYSDSLIIEIDTPCSGFLVSEVKGTASGGKTLVWLPDTTGKVGETEYCIPLFANTAEQITENLAFNAKIKYDATLFQPDIIYTSYLLGTDRFVVLNGSNIKISNKNTTIGEFCGTILLADKDRTPLIIDNFSWTAPGIETEKKDGSLTLTGVCARNLSRLKLIESEEITLAPNPAEDFLEINIGAIGIRLEQNIEIFSVYGEKVLKVILTTQYPLPNTPMKIDVSGLTQGIYFVRVGDKADKFIKL